MTANVDIRRQAKASGVALWQIAKELGFSEPTMTRRLREELSPPDRAKILAIIAALAAREEK